MMNSVQIQRDFKISFHFFHFFTIFEGFSKKPFSKIKTILQHFLINDFSVIFINYSTIHCILYQIRLLIFIKMKRHLLMLENYDNFDKEIIMTIMYGLKESVGYVTKVFIMKNKSRIQRKMQSRISKKKFK
jgi:hypothetical protein